MGRHQRDIDSEHRRDGLKAAKCNAVDSDYERAFVGHDNISMMHFYCIETKPGLLTFSYGYKTTDGLYNQGVAAWDVAAGVFYRHDK